MINGVCASTSAQLPDVQYRLVRVLARIFGLGWSQANINVLTNEPPPTEADFQGFPVMHFADPISCVPISQCFPSAAVPKFDDVTALASLYPAAGGNPSPTGGLWGSVYFTDSSGTATQMMQGVNVVARMMVNGQPSRQYVVSSVSGYSFVGNAGNIITGYMDPGGIPFNYFGSSNTSVEGIYNLGELVIPAGQTYVEYQLSAEALDPRWSTGVGPYTPAQVEPSGSFAPVVVTVTSDTNSERDILMLGSEAAQAHPGSGSTYQTPAPLPTGAAWGSWITGYGSADFFQFHAQANRTASVAVTAFDEVGKPTESKLLPVIGIWELSDQSGDPAPAATPSAFNSMTLGMTRLDAQFGSSEAYRIGIADYRGDGRPDYFYQASVLYSDTVAPARLSVAGGVTTLEGIGFQSGMQVSVGSGNAVVLTQSATAMQVAMPSAPQDGLATIQVTNPVDGSFSQMIGALTYGAAATDLLQWLQSTEPPTPVGGQAPNLLRVRATAADGVTPVNGATIVWSSTNGIEFSACSGESSCVVLTDAVGEASTWVTPTATGPGTITAELAPASYSPAQMLQTTLVGTETALDLAAIAPTFWIAKGATLAVPLTVEALDLGAPKANVAVQFTVTNGTASLSSNTATTNSSGLASVTAQVTNLSATAQVSACVSPANSPCQTFTLFAVPASAWKLEAVSGTVQVVPNGQQFQPLVMRVTDGSSADNPVMGVNVTFLTTLERNPQGPGGGPPPGGDFAGQNDMPIILGTSQRQAITGQDGLASMTPTVGSLGPCDAFITVSAGSASAQFELENVDPRTAEQQPPKKGGGASAVPSTTPAEAVSISVQTPVAGTILVAVPQEMPSSGQPATVCSDSTQEPPCGAAPDAAATGTAPVAQTDVTTPAPDSPQISSGAESLLPEVKPAAPAVDPPSKTTPANTPETPNQKSAATVPAAQSAALLDDRRSCRFAEKE